MENRVSDDFQAYYNQYRSDHPTGTIDVNDVKEIRYNAFLALIDVFSTAKNKRDIKKSAKMLLDNKHEVQSYGLWKYLNEELLKEALK
ncbi:hypothetical protein P7G51_08070 [Enterococcus asini]|uniref:hypothetical protein n=1 Tax=Enterococcus asini TaxID=57732 RepID=UPI00288D511A|nr:hypothetical protein [Enterococcus asini]MDT2757335.1 hypothetical protein [Enterococcus asini]